MFFANHARSVTLVCAATRWRRACRSYLVDQIRAQAEHRRRAARRGRGRTRRRPAGGDRRRDSQTGEADGATRGGLFVFIGADAETGWLPPEIARDRNGYVLTGAGRAGRGAALAVGRDPYLLETSVPGIFACGDVRYSPVKRVAAAVGEGSMAIAFVHQYLRDEATVSTST